MIAVLFHIFTYSSSLQGFVQIPDLTVWYGPDTYMGRNLAQLFTSLADMPDEEVQKLHPRHTQASVKALLPRLHYFEEGTCIVHHIFGGEVTELVRKAYNDAYLTAHFEVSLAVWHVLPALPSLVCLLFSCSFCLLSAEVAFIFACVLERSLLSACKAVCLGAA